MTRERKTEIWSLILVAGFVLSVSYHYIQAAYLGKPYPANTFLFRPWDRFGDFFNVCRNSLHPYIESATTTRWDHLPYPPAMCAFAAAFAPFAGLTGFALFVAIFLAAFLWYCAPIYKTSDRITTIRNAIILVGMSYPILFALDRGNFEIYVFVAVAIFVYLFENKRYRLAAPFLGLAIAFKITPVVFIGLYIARRQIYEALSTLGYAAVFTLVGLLIIPGPMRENIAGWLHNMGMFSNAFAVNWEGWPFSVSLSSAVRTIGALLHPDGFDPNQPLGTGAVALLRGTLYVSVFLGVIVGGYAVFFQKTLWKQVLLLVLCLNHLPNVSGDYKLLYVFIPMAMMVRDSGRTKYEMAFTVLLGLLLIPKTYCLLFDWQVWVGQWIQFEVTEGVVLNPLLGLALGLLVFLSGAGSSDDPFLGRGFPVIAKMTPAPVADASDESKRRKRNRNSNAGRP